MVFLTLNIIMIQLILLIKNNAFSIKMVLQKKKKNLIMELKCLILSLIADFTSRVARFCYLNN